MITRNQAIDLFQSDDLIGIGIEADAVRRKLHPELIVSYSVEAVVEGLGSAIARLDFDKRETIDRWIDRLEAAWRIQDETGSFVALTPGLTGTSVEYLKALAICRIYFENIPNIQSPAEIASVKVCQIALRFGANDLGAVGSGIAEEEIRRLIREAGFTPKQRDALFRSLSLN